VDDQRGSLRVLSERLLRLHRLLLDRQRFAYEARHGAVPARDLFNLLLNDEAFAWLRPLSQMVARIDELVDARGPVAEADARRLLQEAHALVKSDAQDAFHDNYRDALQDSADVVMAHAEVSKLFKAPRARQ
jgi:hypothetical protein